MFKYFTGITDYVSFTESLSHSGHIFPDSALPGAPELYLSDVMVCTAVTWFPDWIYSTSFIVIVLEKTETEACVTNWNSAVVNATLMALDEVNFTKLFIWEFPP